MKKEKTAKTEKNEKHWERVTQEFAPVCDADCRVLILGTAPSKKSREVGFYYGHPQNRFWKMLAAVTGERVPQSIAEKKALLLRNHIALHDVIHSCDIIGSSDSSIKNVVPTDLRRITDNSAVTRVFCNGKTSGKYYEKYHEARLGIKATVLPSTSPANAIFTLDRLTAVWGEELFGKQNTK